MFEKSLALDIANSILIDLAVIIIAVVIIIGRVGGCGFPLS